MVQDALAKVKTIQDKMRAAQSRQKAYANHRWRDLELSVGDMVFMKISPMKGVLRFRKKGKLSPRYIGPYKVLERVGKVAHWLAMPTELEGILPVFHMSMLRKYLPDPSHVLR